MQVIEIASLKYKISLRMPGLGAAVPISPPHFPLYTERKCEARQVMTRTGFHWLALAVLLTVALIGGVMIFSCVGLT